MKLCFIYLHINDFPNNIFLTLVMESKASAPRRWNLSGMWTKLMLVKSHFQSYNWFYMMSKGSPFCLGWLACLEVINKYCSPLSSLREKPARSEFNFDHFFGTLMVINNLLVFAWYMLKQVLNSRTINTISSRQVEVISWSNTIELTSRE